MVIIMFHVHFLMNIGLGSDANGVCSSPIRLDSGLNLEANLLETDMEESCNHLSGVQVRGGGKDISATTSADIDIAFRFFFNIRILSTDVNVNNFLYIVTFFVGEIIYVLLRRVGSFA